MSLETRLAQLVLNGVVFTADDVTENGNVALDASHQPNARQNGIGSLFNAHSRAGHIRWTGEVVRSGAPHRKGGGIRVWQGTTAGRSWARRVLS